MLTMLLASAVGGISTSQIPPPPLAAPVRLERKWSVGERVEYAVKAEYTTEERQGIELTFSPSDLTIAYRFTLDVVKAKADGIVDAIYRRPATIYTIGDTADRGPVSRTERDAGSVAVTLSPINEVLDAKVRSARRRSMGPQGEADTRILQAIGEFVGEIQRLSFFVGGFDAALDIAPRFPLVPVRPGDTWKRTVGYLPQKLKGKANQLATQRLDYEYRYVGAVVSRGVKVERVTATLSLKSDLAEFGRQIAGSGGASEISKVPITLDAKIEFDLDPKTRRTIRAVATAKNSYQIYLQDLEGPIQEERANGTTTLSLVGTKRPK